METNVLNHEEQLVKQIAEQAASFFAVLKHAKEQVSTAASEGRSRLADPYVDKKGVAKYLGRSIGTVERYMTTKPESLPYYRRGNNQVFFKLSEVDEWMSNYRFPRKT